MPTYRHRGEPCVSRDASGSILNPYLEAIILLNLAPTVGLRDRNGYLYLSRFLKKKIYIFSNFSSLIFI